MCICRIYFFEESTARQLFREAREYNQRIGKFIPEISLFSLLEKKTANKETIGEYERQQTDAVIADVSLSSSPMLQINYYIKNNKLDRIKNRGGEEGEKEEAEMTNAHRDDAKFTQINSCLYPRSRKCQIIISCSNIPPRVPSKTNKCHNCVDMKVIP